MSSFAVVDVVCKKTRGFLRLFEHWYSGVRLDGPMLGFWDAFRWHSVTVENQIRHYLRKPPRVEPVEVHLVGYEHPILLRPQTSDYWCYRQVFCELEYSDVEGIADVKFILDCGGNAGYASIYFLHRFPMATVLTVEPDPENVTVCQRNLRPYGARATVLQGGVWSHRSRLILVPSDFGLAAKWAMQVREMREDDSEVATIPAFDIPSLLRYAGVTEVDILKIDIERSELPLFKSSSWWLSRVRNLIIELHGEDCSQAFFSALQRYEYRLSHRGDLTYCLDLRNTLDDLSAAGSTAESAS